MERRLSSRLLSSAPQMFSASLPLLGRPAAKTRANAAGMCSLAALTGSIRSIIPTSSATPPSLDHMALSDRGMALGMWCPTVIADTAGSSLIGPHAQRWNDRWPRRQARRFARGMPDMRPARCRRPLGCSCRSRGWRGRLGGKRPKCEEGVPELEGR
jgi:hypothetical protein